MNKFLLTLIVGFGLSGALLVCVPDAIASTTIPPVSDADLAVQARSLSQQIATLEVQILLLQAIYNDQAEPLIILRDQRNHLRTQFDALPVQNRSEVLKETIVQAIELQLVQLQTEYAQNHNFFNDQHPFQQLTAQRIQLLQQAISAWHSLM